MTKYLEILYNKDKKPITNYPIKFAKYIINRFDLKNKKILEIGCGRGDFINEFSNQNINCSATDIDENSIKNLNDNIIFSKNNILIEKLDFPNNSFDFIYSKSVIEHLEKHENFFNEIMRVLKVNGKLLTLTPDWESQYLHFYDDTTHIKPFTIISLDNIHLLNNFTNCSVEKFYQLPIVWKYPFIKIFLKFIAIFIPIRCKIKFLRFSKELMLLSIASKKQF
jgi:2-polyprenyl-3-methyl-5-hydroxy-6-metoxy-1,4-benzoquinol methylase